MGKGKVQKYKEPEVVEEEEEFDDEEEEESPSEVEAKFVNGLKPLQRRRVYSLIGLQKLTSDLNRQFVKELSQLEKKYDELNRPHFNRRKALVNGEEEPTVEEIKAGTEDSTEEGVKADLATAAEDKSFKEAVPNFWKIALSNHEEIEQLITEKDAEALQHLKDISTTLIEVKDSEEKGEYTTGFSLNFEFDTNPFFKNSVLTKTYYTVAEGRELLMDKAEGTDIDWYPKKNLTMVEKQKTQRKGNQTRTVTRQEPCDSFFKFFSPPQVTGEEDPEEEEELEGEVESDYEVGCILKDSIVPKAVGWYTGDAIPKLELPPGMLGLDGLDEESDDEDGDAKPKGKEDCPQQ